MIVIFRLIELNINLFLPNLLLYCIVISWGERVDIYDAAMRENFIVYQRGEPLATQAEPDMAARGCIEKASLRRINTLEQLHRLTLLLKVNQVFVVLEDLDISEGSPGVLDFFCGHLVFGFLGELAPSLLIAAPRPLDLDSGDVIHGEAMVLEQAPSQRHLIRCLDQPGAKVSHALLLIFGHHVEGGGEELLPQVLGRRKVLLILRGGILGRTVRIVPNRPLNCGSSRLFHSDKEKVIRGLLALHFSIFNGVHVLPEEVMAHGRLNFSGCQVLGSHRSRPGLVNDFLIEKKKR